MPIKPQKIPQKIDPLFTWLDTDMALAFTEIRHPNTPLVVEEITKHYKSLTPADQKIFVAKAKTANNEISNAFLASIEKSGFRR